MLKWKHIWLASLCNRLRSIFNNVLLFMLDAALSVWLKYAINISHFQLIAFKSLRHIRCDVALRAFCEFMIKTNFKVKNRSCSVFDLMLKPLNIYATRYQFELHCGAIDSTRSNLRGQVFTTGKIILQLAFYQYASLNFGRKMIWATSLLMVSVIWIVQHAVLLQLLFSHCLMICWEEWMLFL